MLETNQDYSSIDFLDLMNPADRTQIKSLFQTAEPDLIYEFESTISPGLESEKYFRWKFKLKNDKFYLYGRDVTERRKIKSELIRNEERFRRLSEFSFESIVIHDNGVIIDCNPTFINTFGYKDEEVIGMNVFHFLPRIYRKILRNENNSSAIETLAVRKDSSTFPAEVITKTIESGDKTIYSLSIRDNTDRKKLENELLKTTVFQKAILDSSNFGIISTDFNGLIKTFNKGAEKMFQIKNEEVIDKRNIIDLYLKSEIEKRAKELSTTGSRTVIDGFEVLLEGLQFKTTHESEWLFRLEDNLEKTMSITVTTLKDNLGEISGYLFMITDITDKKKAENENIEKSQILKGILSNMPVFVFKVDSNGIFTQSIGTGLHNLKLEENELVGSKFSEVFPEKKEAIAKAFGGEYISFIYSKNVDSKDIYYQYYIFPDAAQKCGLIGFALDITDRIKSEQLLKESAAHLSKINKELDQFAYVVSHDLKAPLRAIANLSEWIEEDLGKEIKEEVRSNMVILRGRVFRMQNLIDGILSYSRVGRAKAAIEKINVDALVKEVISVVGVSDKFRVNILKDLPTVVTNSTWLEQVFSNLVSNAIKYHDKPSGTITIDYHQFPDFHEFSVADDGPGIAPEFHEKIFVIFQTLNARDNKESTGVGLAIVKKIIEEQGGSIRVESEEGKGAKFIFTIPKVKVGTEVGSR
jgi:PAS domain S-box-containing protein